MAPSCHPPRRLATVPSLDPAAWSPLLGDLQACSLVLAMTTGLAALYLVKSALGIDLMPGPSPLHNLLYPLLGRG